MVFSSGRVFTVISESSSLVGQGDCLKSDGGASVAIGCFKGESRRNKIEAGHPDKGIAGSSRSEDN